MHLAKTEVYRGCRAGPVALTGVFALAGGALQSWLFEPVVPMEFVRFWVEVAIISTAAWRGDRLELCFCSIEAGRRVTRKVLGQFSPCVAAGALMTSLLVRHGDTLVGLLPGLWAVLFSLGLFAARPYLPRRWVWVAWFYLLAESVLLWMASHE